MRRRGCRGFSTSGSFLVIVVGVFVAFSTFYSSTAHTAERVQEAQTEGREHRVTVLESAVTMHSATHDGSSTLEIRINNTGDHTFAVSDVDVLADGEYVPLSEFETVAVEGGDSDVWRPGEQLRLVDSDRTAAPDRVKVVTGPGVAATAEVNG